LYTQVSNTPASCNDVQKVVTSQGACSAHTKAKVPYSTTDTLLELSLASRGQATGRSKFGSPLPFPVLRHCWCPRTLAACSIGNL